jgi:hypothetical protein
LNLVDVNICHTVFGLIREHGEDTSPEAPGSADVRFGS